jgi:hypothetical protein
MPMTEANQQACNDPPSQNPPPGKIGSWITLALFVGFWVIVICVIVQFFLNLPFD